MRATDDRDKGALVGEGYEYASHCDSMFSCVRTDTGVGSELVLMLRPCRDVRLNVSLGEFCGSKDGQGDHTRGFDEGVRPKLDRGKRRKGQLRLQDTNEEQAGVNYSYYRILYS